MNLDCDQKKKLVRLRFEVYAGIGEYANMGNFFHKREWGEFRKETHDFIKHCASKSQQDLLDKFLWDADLETIYVKCGGSLKRREQRQIAIDLGNRLGEILDAVDS